MNDPIGPTDHQRMRAIFAVKPAASISWALRPETVGLPPIQTTQAGAASSTPSRPTDAREHIAAPRETCKKRLSECNQHCITNGMPVIVVHGLETVQVKYDKVKTLTLAPGAMKLSGNNWIKTAAIQ